MIVPNIESNINGVQCYFSDKKVFAYHIIYNESGHLDALVQGNVEIGTIKNLFSATSIDEVKAELITQGIYLDDESQIDRELKDIFFGE